MTGVRIVDPNTGPRDPGHDVTTVFFPRGRNANGFEENPLHIMDKLSAHRFVVIAGQNGSGSTLLASEIMELVAKAAQVQNKKLDIIVAGTPDELHRAIESSKSERAKTKDRVAETLVVFDPTIRIRQRGWKDIFARVSKNVLVENSQGRADEVRLIDDPGLKILIVVPLTLDPLNGRLSQQNASRVSSAEVVRNIVSEATTEVAKRYLAPAARQLLSLVPDIRVDTNGIPTLFGSYDEQGQLKQAFRQLDVSVVDISHFDMDHFSRLFDNFFGVKDAVSTDTLRELHEKIGRGRSDFTLAILEELSVELERADRDLFADAVEETSTNYFVHNAGHNAQRISQFQSIKEKAKHLVSGKKDPSRMKNTAAGIVENEGGRESSNPYDLLVIKAYGVWDDKYKRELALSGRAPEPAAGEPRELR